MSNLVPVLPAFLLDQVFGEENSAVLVNVASNPLFDATKGVGKQVAWLPEDRLSTWIMMYPWMKMSIIRSYTMFVEVYDGKVKVFCRTEGEPSQKFWSYMPGVPWHHVMTQAEIKSTKPIMADTVNDHYLLATGTGFEQQKFDEWAGPVAIVKQGDDIAIVNIYARVFEAGSMHLPLVPIYIDESSEKYQWTDRSTAIQFAADDLSGDLVGRLHELLESNYEGFSGGGAGEEG